MSISVLLLWMVGTMIALIDLKVISRFEVRFLLELIKAVLVRGIIY